MKEKIDFELKINDKFKNVSFAYDSKRKSRVKNKLKVFILVAVVSFIMAIINLIFKNTTMLFSSLMIGLGMFICYILEKSFNKSLLSEICASLLIVLVFTFDMIFETNDSYFILWALLLPALFVTFDNKVALPFGIYMLIFIFVICYTPLNVHAINKYSSNFLLKFPIVVLVDYVVYSYMYYAKNK